VLLAFVEGLSWFIYVVTEVFLVGFERVFASFYAFSPNFSVLCVAFYGLLASMLHFDQFWVIFPVGFRGFFVFHQFWGALCCF